MTSSTGSSVFSSMTGYDDNSRSGVPTFEDEQPIQKKNMVSYYNRPGFCQARSVFPFLLFLFPPNARVMSIQKGNGDARS